MSTKSWDDLNSAYEDVRNGKCTNSESFDSYIEKLTRKEDLTPGDAVKAMNILVSGTATDSQQGAFLTAMQVKKVTVDELAAFAFILRRLAEPISLDRCLLGKSDVVLGDTCGTGGGTLETFNVSTSIMFILAAAGIIIAKHGNRAITSKCGSADVLAELGVNIDLSPAGVEKCISEIGIGFIYAPNFHKAFKNVQKVRKELGIQTVFNILGPLSNPAFFPEEQVPTCHVLGVNSPDLTEKMGEVLKRLKVTRACVVHGYNDFGDKGMDEVSITGKTKVSELTRDSVIHNYEIQPENYGFQRANPDHLSGGNCADNAEIIINLLTGKETGPKRDLILLNAGMGLYVGEKAGSIKEGIELAQKQISNRGAYSKLEQLIERSQKYS